MSRELLSYERELASILDSVNKQTESLASYKVGDTLEAGADKAGPFDTLVDAISVYVNASEFLSNNIDRFDKAKTEELQVAIASLTIAITGLQDTIREKNPDMYDAWDAYIGQRFNFTRMLQGFRKKELHAADYERLVLLFNTLDQVVQAGAEVSPIRADFIKVKELFEAVPKPILSELGNLAEKSPEELKKHHDDICGKEELADFNRESRQGEFIARNFFRHLILIEADRALSDADLKNYQEMEGIIADEIIVMKRMKKSELVQLLVNYLSLIQELLRRNGLVGKSDAEKVSQILQEEREEIGSFLGGKVDKKEKDRANALLVTIETSKTATSEEVAFLREFIVKLEDIYREYFAEYTARTDLGDESKWKALVEIVTILERYINQIQDAITAAVSTSDEARRLREVELANWRALKHPEREALQSEWKSFFVEIAMSSDGINAMRHWAREIFSVFYKAANPQESYLTKLESERFSAWMDALDEVSEKKNTFGGVVRDINHPDFDSRWYRLKRDYDTYRGLTDSMITFGQSRSLTADWHSPDMMRRMGGELQALRGITPGNTFDYNIMSSEEAQRIENIRAKKEKRAPQKIIHYEHAALVSECLELMIVLLRTKGSRFYRKNWQEDDTSKDALKGELIAHLKSSSYKDAAGEPIDDSTLDEIVNRAYNVATFCAMRMDTYAETLVAGDSPPGEIVPRISYLGVLCSWVGQFYAAYSMVRPLVEATELYYYPEQLFERFDQELTHDSEDFLARVLTIKQSLHLTEQFLHHYAHPRTHDEVGQCGYNIDFWENGLQRKPYPSMLDWLTNPYYQQKRILDGHVFKNWVEGYYAFEAYLAQSRKNLNCEGKKPGEAVEFLTNELLLLIDKISGLKTNMNIDWNYIAMHMVIFTDRMYRALHESMEGKPQTSKDGWRFVMYSLIGAIVGRKGDWFNEVKNKLHELADPTYPTIPKDLIERVNVGSGKITTAGEVDLFRTLPSSMDIEEKKRIFKGIVRQKIEKIREERRAAGKPFNEAEERENLTELFVPFAQFIQMRVSLQTPDAVTRRHMNKVYTARERAADAAVKLRYAKFYAIFHRTVLGESSEDQGKNALGKKNDDK